MPPTTTDAGLDLLTGAEAAGILGAALEPAGGRLVRWALRDVDHRPADRTTASYTATVAWQDGEREETLGASIAADVPARSTDGCASGNGDGGGAPGCMTVTDGDQHIQVWRFPFDPELPALAGACFPSTVAELLRQLGIAASPDGVELRVVSYRPRKRAVVEVRVADGTRIFLKVLRPRVVREVDRRHGMLTEAGVAVPRSLGWSADGMIALDALPGVAMSTALATREAAQLPPEALVGLLDRLPADVARLPRRQPWWAHAAHYAGVVSAACPELRERVHDVAGRIEAELRGQGAGDEPTHGDFYDAQLLMTDGAVTGLIDIDTLGPGRRADDLACLLAHLSVHASAPAGAGARAAIDAWRPAFEQRVDARELHVRTAGVLLSLATGPYRAQEPGWRHTTLDRIVLAERWLDAGIEVIVRRSPASGHQ